MFIIKISIHLSGLAAALASFAFFFGEPDPGDTFLESLFIRFTIALGVFIGILTLAGSMIACLKLQGSIRGSPFLIPLRHLWNALALAVVVALGALFVASVGGAIASLIFLLAIAAITTALGIHFVIAIGGAGQTPPFK